jgi:shikimate dehydrogenase
LEKAQQMVAEFAPYGTVFASSYEALAGKSFDVVVNATSSSLSDELPPLPSGLFTAKSLAYDMKYGKQTPFLKFAAEQGAAQRADGLGMLVEQAAEAFTKWREVRPGTAAVIASLRA